MLLKKLPKNFDKEKAMSNFLLLNTHRLHDLMGEWYNKKLKINDKSI